MGLLEFCAWFIMVTGPLGDLIKILRGECTKPGSEVGLGIRIAIAIAGCFYLWSV